MDFRTLSVFFLLHWLNITTMIHMSKFPTICASGVVTMAFFSSDPMDILRNISNICANVHVRVCHFLLSFGLVGCKTILTIK